MEKRSIKQNGGKRKGAGRKKAKHTIASEQARAYLVAQIKKHLAPIVSAQIEAAKGISYIGDKGKIFTKIPDTKVGEYLLNQVAGKPTLTAEISSKDDEPLMINLFK